MPFFDDLIKDPNVLNHPLLKGYRDISENREMLEKYSKAIDDELKDPHDLEDIFSEAAPSNKFEKKDFRSQVYNASMLLHDILCQFEVPLFPKVAYVGLKDAKYASNNPKDLVSGVVAFDVTFQTLTGVKKTATIPIPICKGELVLPSVMYIDGSMVTISQYSIDELIDRNTIYDLPSLRPNYAAPPMPYSEKELAVGIRNQMGWKPSVHDVSLHMQQKSSAIGLPKMYREVVEDMQKALDEGEDTFPRSWVHVLNNYILRHVSTASKDAWEKHLINDGFCLDLHGNNRGRCVKKSSDKSSDFDKELALEVTDQPEDLESPEGLEGLDEVMGEGSQIFYPDTKTPIEEGDLVKVLKGPGGQGFRGQIVDVSSEEGLLIVRSKGIEYRVKLDDIEPLPGTFKKMYK
jgi:hypothetical protein